MAEPMIVDTPSAGDRIGMERVRPTRGGSALLGIVGALVGLAALAASAWVYAEGRRDMLRLSTEIAQLRLSLDLYAQQQGTAAPTADATSAPDLLDLSNRLAILEQQWRSGSATPPALPATPSAPAAAAASSGDCLPPGMRFMVAPGDSWPVCGTGAVVEIAAVDNGFISLGDGTVIAQGGNIALPGSQCMIGVMPSDGALSGFAEIRVTC